MIGFSFSWISPAGLLGLPLSGLGLLLGIAGLVIAIIQRGRGIGFPIAGSAVSLVALVMGVFWLGLLGAAGKQNAANEVIAVSGIDQNQEQNNLAAAKPPREKRLAGPTQARTPFSRTTSKFTLEPWWCATSR